MRPTAPSKTSTAAIRNRLTFFSIPAKRLGVAYSSCIAFSLADLAAASNYGCIVVTVLSACDSRWASVTGQGDTMRHARTDAQLVAVTQQVLHLYKSPYRRPRKIRGGKGRYPHT